MPLFWYKSDEPSKLKDSFGYNPKSPPFCLSRGLDDSGDEKAIEVYNDDLEQHGKPKVILSVWEQGRATADDDHFPLDMFFKVFDTIAEDVENIRTGKRTQPLEIDIGGTEYWHVWALWAAHTELF